MGKQRSLVAAGTDKVLSPPPISPSEDADQISEVAHWLAPHWGYLVSLALAAVGVIWRAASLVSEIRALRRDHNLFMAEYRRDAQAWRIYVDRKFDSMNGRLDNMADR